MLDDVAPTTVWIDQPDERRKDHDYLNRLFTSRGHPPVLLQPAGSCCLYRQEGGDAGVVTQPPSWIAQFNLTWRDAIPEGLEGSGVTLLHNATVYSRFFAKKGL